MAGGIEKYYNDHINRANVPDKVAYWSLIIAGAFSLYVWLVALVSLCAGVSLTSWLLPYNVFWYVVAGGAFYLLILIFAIVHRCMVGDKVNAKNRAGRWILYSFLGLFFYVIFFVLTLTFGQYYNLVANDDTIVNRNTDPVGSLFQTVPSVASNSPANINAAIAVVNSNFGLAVVAASGEALSNWFAILVIIFFGTSIVFLLTVMMVVSPWNEPTNILADAIKNAPKAKDAKNKIQNKF
jgi:preprotein translocase subunit SecG